MNLELFDVVKMSVDAAKGKTGREIDEMKLLDVEHACKDMDMFYRENEIDSVDTMVVDDGQIVVSTRLLMVDFRGGIRNPFFGAMSFASSVSFKLLSSTQIQIDLEFPCVWKESCR